ncbi:MAG: DUF58 domain-containing protein [Deltaproteobacteria bacterium]|nr:MAG: DUF58 domain-containing protein [Deltaproteobacteria bacterium]
MQAPAAASPVSIDLPRLMSLRTSGIALEPPSHGSRASHSGEYLSRSRGRGMEFAEVRAYQPGDDVRTIDWKVTARRGRVHTKLFHEERERPVLLAIDYRRPMFFATRGRFKAVLASELAARAAWSALAGGNRVGGFLFSEERHIELRPAGGHRGVLRLLQQMVADPVWQRRPHAPFEPQQRLANTVSRLARVVRPGTLVWLFSDCAQWDEVVEKQLALMSRRAELALLFCFDTLEADLPTQGRYRVSNGRDELTVVTGDVRLRRNYRARFQERHQAIKAFCHRYRIYFRAVATSDDPEQVDLPMNMRRTRATP